MQFDLQSKGLWLPADSISAIENHIRIALGGDANRITTIQVMLHRSSGAQNFSCQMIGWQSPTASIRVEEVASSLDESIDWAIWRMKRRLKRQGFRGEPWSESDSHPPTKSAPGTR